MAKKYRVGIIGFGHVHVTGVAKTFASHPQVEWVACADTAPLQPELRKAAGTRAWNQEQVVNITGISKVYADYREMLDKERFDIMLIESENAQHGDIIEACAVKGVHVCTDKPLAVSMSEALRAVRACQTAGVTLLTNWNPTYEAWNLTIKACIEKGLIGRVLEVKMRYGGAGPLGRGRALGQQGGGEQPLTGNELGATWWHQAAAGGGALLDFCGYGCAYARWYIGQPATAAFGLKANLDSPWCNAEDNAYMIVRFTDAVLTAESTWTQVGGGPPYGPFVLGTEGTLMSDRRDGQQVAVLRLPKKEPVVCQHEPLREGRENVAKELIHHLETGEPLHELLTVPFNLDVTAMLDAGIRSAQSGRMEIINNPSWTIG